MTPETSVVETPAPVASENEKTLLHILVMISFCHFLNDMIQSLLPSIYPILKTSYQLSFSQVGIVTLTYQITASLLQPLIGLFTDKRPKPYSLPIGMSLTLIGLVVLALAPNFLVVLCAASMVGMGSAVFHPESSRVARLASGGQHGFAQSFFQVGGNSGAALGPLLAALIIVPIGQQGVAWFTIAAALGIFVLFRVASWYKHQHVKKKKTAAKPVETLPRATVIRALAVLVALVFSKYFYLSSLSSYYTFYLMERFHVSVQNSQFHLFAFSGAVAAGTLIGGPVGDRYGRKLVIWCSILGVLPFTLMLPHADLFWTGILSVIIGFILSSAFSAILVYGQELIPGRVGMISGLFFGLAFGMGGIGAAVLGRMADSEGIVAVYNLCAWLPLLGLLTVFLPNIKGARAKKATT